MLGGAGGIYQRPEPSRDPGTLLSETLQVRFSAVSSLVNDKVKVLVVLVVTKN